MKKKKMKLNALWHLQSRATHKIEFAFATVNLKFLMQNKTRARVIAAMQSKQKLLVSIDFYQLSFISHFIADSFEKHL